MSRFKVTFTAITAFLSSLLGILYIPVLLMVSCNIIDYITGLLAVQYRNDKLNSYRSIRGITKKVCMWLLVIVGAIIDRLMQYASETIGIQPPLKFLVACVVCMWIICSELLSILENIVDIGVPLPPFLMPLVKMLKDQAEKAGKLDNVEKKDGEKKEEKGSEDNGAHSS